MWSRQRRTFSATCRTIADQTGNSSPAVRQIARGFVNHGYLVKHTPLAVGRFNYKAVLFSATAVGRWIALSGPTPREYSAAALAR